MELLNLKSLFIQESWFNSKLVLNPQKVHVFEVWHEVLHHQPQCSRSFSVRTVLWTISFGSHDAPWPHMTWDAVTEEEGGFSRLEWASVCWGQADHRTGSGPEPPASAVTTEASSRFRRYLTHCCWWMRFLLQWAPVLKGNISSEATLGLL